LQKFFGQKILNAKKNPAQKFSNQIIPGTKNFTAKKFRPQKFPGAKSAKIENCKMGLFFKSGMISPFQELMKNLEPEKNRA
jgi:hypothetical protein